VKPRILVVEDERAIQLALSGLLRREGYEVACAGDGAGAIAQLREAPVDLVLTDLALGDGPSGMDVLRASKEIRPESPVIMITAHGSEQIAVDAMKGGAESASARSSSRSLPPRTARAMLASSSALV